MLGQGVHELRLVLVSPAVHHPECGMPAEACRVPIDAARHQHEPGDARVPGWCRW